jgi:hypothetical protein
VVVVAADERQALIARYTSGYARVLEALAGATDAELDLRSEGWTAREVVHHLADSEMTSAIRLRRLLVEDQPVLQGYPEEEFARRLWYTQRPLQAALDAFRAARQTTAEILERMTEADWAREGTHTESGRYTATDWLHSYAAHAYEHAEQIERSLQAARAERRNA